MRLLRFPLVALLAASVVLVSQASSHREAPITALDHKADITDWFAFVSYDGPSKVTMIMNVDPLLEPANGPNWFPFDDEILYEMKIDNDNDAREDVVFQFRFFPEATAAGFYQLMLGTPGGATAPANSPPPVTPGTSIVPDRITGLTSPGLIRRQTYAVTMIDRGTRTELRSPSGALLAVPPNVGPRTMDYAALFAAGIFELDRDIRVFAGTVDDPFYADLGAAFDTFNFRGSPPGVLSAAQDASQQNSAPDMVSGYAVNTIAIEVPIELLTRTRRIEPASSPAGTIGTWATTSRRQFLIRRPPLHDVNLGDFRQVQRLGNPLINELAIGMGWKDRYSMDQPRNDVQFRQFLLDPQLARVVNALTNGAVAIPPPPRTDLLPLLQYTPPIAAAGTPPGPIADLLRLNTGVPATPLANASRLGLLAGDSAGFPNGRRVLDDVIDITLRLVVGGVLASPFPGFDPEIGGRLGDGVNGNDVPYQPTFPYVGLAPSGRDRRHIDPGEPMTTGDPTQTTATTLMSSPNPSTFGQAVTFTATVNSPGGTPAGGTVTFREGTNILAGPIPLGPFGQVSIAISSLSVGNHIVTADYSGTASFSDSSSSAPHTVNRANTTMTLNSSPNPSAATQPVGFTINATSTAGPFSGAVTVFNGTLPIGTASFTNGVGTFTRSFTLPGTYNITVVFPGNATLNGTTSNIVIQIVNAFDGAD